MSGSPDAPAGTRELVRGFPDRPNAELERVRRKLLGRYVRSFENVQTVAMAHGDDAIDGLEPFQAIERVQSVTLDDVRQRQAELFVADSYASVTVGAG